MNLSSWQRLLLKLPGLLYGAAVRLRLGCYRFGMLRPRRLPAIVISVGNLTVGGTGKTPCVSFIARHLAGRGISVAILSRGYRRQSQGLVEVSDGTTTLVGAREGGDEPWLLARACPGVRVVVDRQRYEAGCWLLRHTTVSVFLLDDGYQHLRLARDLNLLLVDAAESPDNWHLVPAGRLREPLSGMRRADAVIVTRSDHQFDQELLEARLQRWLRPETPIIYAWHELRSLHTISGELVAESAALAGRAVAAIAGIARPEIFFEDLRRLGMRTVLTQPFADHHRYTRAELEMVIAKARAAGASALLITEKDAANLPGDLELTTGDAGLPILVARLEFRCRDEQLLTSILDRVATRKTPVEA